MSIFMRESDEEYLDEVVSAIHDLIDRVQKLDEYLRTLEQDQKKRHEELDNRILQIEERLKEKISEEKFLELKSDLEKKIEDLRNTVDYLGNAIQDLRRNVENVNHIHKAIDSVVQEVKEAISTDLKAILFLLTSQSITLFLLFLFSALR